MMVALAAVFTFAACETTPEEPTPSKGTKIAAPQVEITDVVEDGFTAKWGAVENAKSYSVVLSKANSSKTETQNVTETSVTFSGLGIGTYTVSVKAIANEGYKDSDYAKATTAVEGATSVEWFELSVFVTNDYASKGYYSYNSVFYTMKGTNVASVSVMIATAEAAASYTTEEILSKLQPESADTVSAINTADGFFSVVKPCPADTELVFYALAENTDGASVFTQKTVKTAEVVVPEAFKPWIGTYTASYTKLVSGNGTITDTAGEFTLIMDYDPANDALAVGGISAAFGLTAPTLAFFNDEGTLEIYTGIGLGTAQGYEVKSAIFGHWSDWDETTQAWILDEKGPYVFDDFLPAYSVVKAADGAITAEPLSIEYDYQNEAGEALKAKIDVLSIGIFGFNAEGVAAWDKTFYAGSWNLVKTSDEVIIPEDPETAACSYNAVETISVAKKSLVF